MNRINNPKLDQAVKKQNIYSLEPFVKVTNEPSSYQDLIRNKAEARELEFRRVKIRYTLGVSTFLAVVAATLGASMPLVLTVGALAGVLMWGGLVVYDP